MVAALRMHFTELEEEEEAARGQPEARAPVQPQVQAPVQPQVQAQEPLVIFEEEMEYTDSTRLNLGTLPIYTGTKEEDRPKFLREFANMCENFVRQHNANIRRTLRTPLMSPELTKFDPLEIVVAWDKEEEDADGVIPTELYEELVLKLRAHLQSEKKKRME
ncbi:hypothetical protein CYMTET_7068 [Cymbomonas tetramitiformis]|uniref:Uncharacterized protein n=1 Tax=Cymbomonas tetramitiformis TaxID=36881 RepID=A0AAE0LHT8_9CHLO|nr:hypothetical protein CYMTET_7068 [Cymbomonas tetramitiformis]